MRVLVFGTFDRLHPGHQFFLTEAGKRGELLVVVARDMTVKKVKGRAPMESEQERLRKVQCTFPQAKVFLGDESDHRRPARDLHPDLILLGYDQKLPPGVSLEDLPCSTGRLPAYQPEHFKSSKFREEEKG